MPEFIDAWRKSTGEKLPDPIPSSWIDDEVNPDITDHDPGVAPEAPATTTPAQPEPAPEQDPTNQEA